LAAAVEEINIGKADMGNNSCSTDLKRSGVELTYKRKNSLYPNMLGFGSYDENCMSGGDALQIFEDEEQMEHCKSLIDDACDNVDAPVVSSVTCPCFDENDLALVVHKINNDKVDMDNNSCSTDSNSDGATLLYSPKNSSDKKLGYGSFAHRCMFGGNKFRMLANEKKIERCESLMKNACDALDVPVVSPIKCPCFDKEDLAAAVEEINIGKADMGNNSCSTDLKRSGVELTYKRKNSLYPNMLGFGSYDENCMSGGDALQIFEDEEQMEHCKSLIDDACDNVDAPVVSSVTCPCFDKHDLKNVLWQIKNNEVEPVIHENEPFCVMNSGTQELMVYATTTLSTERKVMGFGVDENGTSCMIGGVTSINTTEEEGLVCGKLMKSACMVFHRRSLPTAHI